MVPLNAVWDNIPASLEYPLTAGERLTPLYAGAGIGSQPHPLLTIEVGDIPDRVVDAGSREALTEFLEAYPGTSGHDGFVIRTVEGVDVPNYERHHADAGWLADHALGHAFGGRLGRTAPGTPARNDARVCRSPVLLPGDGGTASRSPSADGVVGRAVWRSRISAKRCRTTKPVVSARAWTSSVSASTNG
ncbi:hypothetical protein ABZ353_35860 [Streptomyces niveus]|uniref:hypothetical protein n=1 Tax=Streptomyces niveus TaxID=193462 RepID=UPI0033D484D4